MEDLLVKASGKPNSSEFYVSLNSYCDRIVGKEVFFQEAGFLEVTEPVSLNTSMNEVVYIAAFPVKQPALDV